ncbi:2-succinyl-5-enolpyruvyl-6-hydroxy-3-cyclohexene-1-carboxylic-acid synthase [Vibrio gelatinilyticus]|uniref:2-succinyl-5-enolpyruvyl-6-hydroxy-3- cyclohexene-1-carboxylic-acid synthase n=1 Tax=Vibrio gelatinilyticus TaxID=2893468 RepID=UPI003CC6AAAA
MNNQAALNRVWTQTLLEELYRLGVNDICIAPGSRSTPLTLEAVEHGCFNIHTHFDERGLGFMALGLAKVSRKPVVVIVTSGTAVTNLLPAVAESKLTGEKLILLTSDRPLELIGCGANQAIEQPGVFAPHVSDAVNLPSPSTQIPLAWLLTTIDHIQRTQEQFGGAIHLNCPFPEPLYGGEDKSEFTDYIKPIQKWQVGHKPYVRYMRLPATSYQGQISQLNLANKKGAIVLGALSLAHSQQALMLANQLGWPVLCDPQSGVGSEWGRFDIWLQNGKANALLSQCDLIVQIGERLVSKRLLQWIEQQGQSGTELVLVTEQSQRINPNHLPMLHWQAELSKWLDEAKNLVDNSRHCAWAEELSQYCQLVGREIKQAQPKHISEIDVAESINQLPSDISLFLGNSLIVRLTDMFVSLKQRDVYTNRGASGIDGLVATAYGVHIATERSLALYLGDTSLLYDLNSLALFRDVLTPNVIVVTNNDGGAIFDLLPVPKQQKQQCYQMPHGLNFTHSAAQFGLQYSSPGCAKELNQLLCQHLKNGSGTLLIEVKTHAQEVGHLIRTISRRLHAS